MGPSDLKSEGWLEASDLKSEGWPEASDLRSEGWRGRPSDLKSEGWLEPQNPNLRGDRCVVIMHLGGVEDRIPIQYMTCCGL